jgi:hypothetical protein
MARGARAATFFLVLAWVTRSAGSAYKPSPTIDLSGRRRQALPTGAAGGARPFD